jgi:hypothetical protein
MVVCKFICESVMNTAAGASVRLRPVHAGSKENEEFYKYTPGGELKLEVINPEASKQFVPGTEYYISISPA